MFQRICRFCRISNWFILVALNHLFLDLWPQNGPSFLSAELVGLFQSGTYSLVAQPLGKSCENNKTNSNMAYSTYSTNWSNVTTPCLRSALPVTSIPKTPKTNPRFKEGYRYICSLCGHSSRDNSTLRVHMRIHTGQKDFACHVCQRKFNTKGNLVRHLRTVHRLAIDNTTLQNTVSFWPFEKMNEMMSYRLMDLVFHKFCYLHSLSEVF